MSGQASCKFPSGSLGIMDERITVTVGDNHIADAHGVAEQLTAAGMHVDQVLGAVGIITGSVPPERRAALEQLPAVAAVEGEHRFQIPSPEADVQ